MFFIGQNSQSHDIFFSWTFDLFFINPRYLVFGVYFSPYQRNIVCEYKLHGKPIMKYQSWTCFWYWCSRNQFFNVKLKLLMNKFLFFSVSWTHFQKQPFADVLKTGVLKIFANFTGKHLYWSPFLKNLKKRLQTRCFRSKFAKFLRTLFSQNTFGSSPLVAASVFFK